MIVSIRIGDVTVSVDTDSEAIDADATAFQLAGLALDDVLVRCSTTALTTWQGVVDSLIDVEDTAGE